MAVSNLPDDSFKKKHIYGTYIEMAFHNMLITLDHIYYMIYKKNLKSALSDIEKNPDGFREKYKKIVNKITNKEYNYNKDDYAHWFYPEIFKKDYKYATPENKERTNALLHLHYPFIRDAKGIFFNKKIPLLRELRNCYSHYKYVPDKDQEEILSDCKEIAESLERIFEESKNEAKKRFFLSKEQVECTNKYKISNGGEKHLTSFGLIFFSSLFLDKKFIKIFLDKTQVVEKQDVNVILNIMSIYRIRMPENKLSCEKGKGALGLDMLNELRRCPKQLYDLLEEDKQKAFRVYDDNGEDVLMLRKKDRFVQLALQYIDENKMFEHLRFHVFLGRYFFKFYDKKCIDSNQADRVRCLHKDLKGFGRLDDIEERRKSEWQDMIRTFENMHPNSSEEQPYITDCKAQYMITGNRIGIWCGDKDGNSYLPYKSGEDMPKNISPDCWLSVHELPALIFYMLLCKDGKPAEEIIEGIINSYKKLFNDIHNGKVIPMSEHELDKLLKEEYNGIRTADIPKKLRDYLFGNNSNNEKRFISSAEKLIRKLIDETEKRLRFLEKFNKQNKDSKAGKHNDKPTITINEGKLAEFLAKDIMFFLPVNESNTNKLTSLNYRVFQANLATFSKEKWVGITKMFKEAHIIDNANPEMNHPFVGKLFESGKRYEGVQEFYNDYLSQRQEYLNACLKRKENYRSLHFLYPNRAKWQKRDTQYYKELARRYFAMDNADNDGKGIELPRGLFSNVIREELASLNNCELTKLAKEDKDKNISYLIQAYIRIVTQDKSQPMYDYPRNYPLIDKLKKSKKKVYVEMTYEWSIPKYVKEKIRKHTSCIPSNFKNRNRKGGIQKIDKNGEEQVLNHLMSEMMHIEQDIKRYKVQDMLLFLMSKSILLSDTNGKNTKLGNIKEFNLHSVCEDRFLSQKIDYSVKVYDKTIRQEELKLKNYGSFYRILSDHRLKSLLNIIKEDEVKKELLDDELSQYDGVHPNVLKTVFDVERKVVEQFPNKNQNKTIGFRECLTELGVDDEVKREKLVRTRNSFAHSSYILDDNIQEKELPYKAKEMYSIFQKGIEPII